MPLARLTSALRRPTVAPAITPSVPLPPTAQACPLQSAVEQLATLFDEVLAKLDRIEQKIDMLT